jgi:hypothetical protein
MVEAQFSRLFGEIRQMGPARREREKPHLDPANIAETLFYRGLVATGYAQAKGDVRTLFVYVPPDLAAVLPAHETGFNLTDQPESAPGPTTGPPARAADVGEEPQAIEAATTMLVDDLATLLAYLQLADVPVEGGALTRQVGETLGDDWLGSDHPARVALLVALAGDMGLAAAEDAAFKPVPAQARHWLEQTRPRQVRALAEAWRASTVYNDLWHTPGLQPEDTGWRNDPLLARQTVLTFLEMAPPADWWPLDDLVALVYESEPDFQRPTGDYESWYIRDAETGNYLRGFEHWDQVDGAVLRFILMGPMHWLGLVDLGSGPGDSALCRLTPYGRALCGFEDWPDPPEDQAELVVEDDGTMRAPRMLSRYERFQLARITEWRAAGDPYVYHLTARGLEQAAAQGIQAEPIRAFLRRASGRPLPDPIVRLLEQWEQGSGAGVWLERAVVLRSDTAEMLTTILETPELRRYLGATLGPTAVLVRAGQETDLATALQQHGILVDIE